ncbi:YceH family protein [Terriglobus roseus]|nr:YceH family protein [Terriglobus roseus]
MQLTAIEVRVLGALIEKEITTPEYYPLSLNALLAACNQKSSRDPVMTLEEADVRTALRSLEDAELVSVDHGSRVQRYEHRARTVFQLRRDETALLALLLLRGPQTPGELRSRADRMHSFDGLDAVVSALSRMCAPTEQRAEPIAVLLARQPGSKEQRYAHTLGDPAELAVAAATTAAVPVEASGGASLAGRVSQLEAEVADLKAAVQRLVEQLGG